MISLPFFTLEEIYFQNMCEIQLMFYYIMYIMHENNLIFFYYFFVKNLEKVLTKKKALKQRYERLHTYMARKNVCHI